MLKKTVIASILILAGMAAQAQVDRSKIAAMRMRIKTIVMGRRNLGTASFTNKERDDLLDALADVVLGGD